MINIADFLNLKPVYRAGGNQLTILWSLDFVYSLFGVSVAASRYLAFAVGLFSVYVWFIYLEKFLGFWAAAYGTAVYLGSVYAAYFAKISYDPGWSLAFLAMAWPACHFAWAKKSKPWALLAGFVVALGMFTYPSFYLGLISVAVGIFIVQPKMTAKTFFASKKWLINFYLMFLAGFAPIFLYALYLHYQYLGKGITPFLAGGGFSPTFKIWWESVTYVFLDLFVASKSWYLLHTIPFVDWGLWILLACAAPLAKRKSDKTFFALLGSIFILFLLGTVSTYYPGARRIIVIFIPLSFLAALSFQHLTTWLAQSPKRLVPIRSFAVCLLLTLPFIYSSYYYYSKGLRNETWQGSVSFPVDSTVLAEALHFGPTYVFDAPGDYDQRYFDSYATVLYHYNKVSKNPLYTIGRPLSLNADFPGRGRYSILSFGFPIAPQDTFKGCTSHINKRVNQFHSLHLTTVDCDQNRLSTTAE